MDRLERLLNLVATLLDTDRLLTAAEVAARVPGYPPPGPSFRRAFERDKETLRSMDIPLITEQIDPGDPEAGWGYRIPRDRYELADPGLEPEEVAALHLAAESVRLEGGEATTAIWKLGGVAAEATPAPAAALPGSDHLTALFAALTSRSAVRFSYRGIERTVDPWGLSFRNGFWYLSGWDHDRGERRTFRLDRLGTSPVAAGNAVHRPPGRSSVWELPWEMGDEEPIAVRVLVDSDQARWAVKVAGAPSVSERRDDGSVVLSLTVRNRDALRSWVLGMLDHAEILDPPEQRAALVEWIRGWSRPG